MKVPRIVETAGSAMIVGVVSIAVTAPAPPARQTTAEQVVEACAEAMGGRERIDAVRTLRLTYTLPDHGGSRSVTEIERPNRIRLGDAVVFDGSRAALLGSGTEPDGTPRSAEVVDSEEWKDFEIDIGRYFPAFFDYPSEYLGTEFIASIETYKLSVSLPLGGNLTYFVERATSLPLMVEHTMTMYGNTYRGQRMFGGYREVDGIQYPHEFSYYSPHWRRMLYLEMDQVEINPDLGQDRFTVPSDAHRRERPQPAVLDRR